MKPQSIVRPRMLRTLLYLTLMTLSMQGQSQTPEEDEPTWYQIEVIVFERLSSNQSGDQEIWPKDIRLDYPPQWQKLMTPEEAEDLLATHQIAATEEQPVDTTLQHPTASSDVSGVLSNTADTRAPQPLPPMKDTGENLEPAFVLLPESERTLNESKGAIARDRSMRVLFHEAWRQPILPANDGPAIILRGGNNYEEHTELEGSIHLSVSRYLHIHTDLWLTQFIPNYGQEPEHWPPLPPVPQRQQRQLPEDPALTLDIGSGQPVTAWDISAPTTDEYTSLVNQPFLIKEITTLKQTRRMRSGELHYIDHPRIGLLVIINSYAPEDDE